jgi:hypothetical protein
MMRLWPLALAAIAALAVPAWAQNVFFPTSTGFVPAPVTSADSGPVVVAAAINSSSHAAGSSLGGLISVPVARCAGCGGILTQVAWVSPNGSTGQIVVRLWQRNPTNTTCTDQTAFVSSAVDDKFLVTPPFALTPAAPAVTTGDAKTYASLTQQTFDFRNSDLVPSTNLYACVLTVGIDTADESSSPWIMLSGPLN